MRRVIYYITISADGMYADLDGGLSQFEPAEDEHRYANRLVHESGDIVMGRVMYDVMEYWDDLDLDDPKIPDVEREFATFWRETPKHVVSHGRPKLRPNASQLQGDVVDTVRQMKAADGPDIMLACGADLLAHMSEAGLIDEYRFLLSPVVLGRGKALFAKLDAPLTLKLRSSTTTSAGGVLLEYVPTSDR